MGLRFRRDMRGELLQVVGREVESVRLEVSRKCLKCGHKMNHLLSGPMMNGYEYELCPCGECGAVHRVVIRPKGYELKLKEEK